MTALRHQQRPQATAVADTDMPLTAADTWRALGRSPQVQDLPKGIDAWWHKAAGWFARRRVNRRKLLARAARILSLEPDYATLSDARLKETAEELRARLRRGRETKEEFDRACAVIREGSKRIFGFRHHQVQIAGGLALSLGCVAEMATGEGKTLTATLPAILAGWRGKGCHVVTVNDYLAARDAEEMGKLYSYFGLSSASIVQEAEPPDRAKGYAADITYLTNKEAAADFLRDRLSMGQNKNLCSALLAELGFSAGSRKGGDGLVQRGLEYAIVDEADSVLIDEACTPLIISGDGPNEEQVATFPEAGALADQLEKDRDYTVDLQYKEIKFTGVGRVKLAELAEPLGGFWKGARRREELVNQALNARIFFRAGAEYILDEGKVVIVDEATGRLMPDRTWRDGLHQAVEAKEKVEVSPPKATFARLSFQRFFRLYRKLSGMTGTGEEARGEFWQIYRLPVVSIPTNRPCRRIMKPQRIFATQERKWNAVVETVKEIHATGRPLLVGTRSVGASETLSERLKAEGLEHQVLNAVYHREEAEIVARAGKVGRITVATNMAGRGTDIKLAKEVDPLGGLHVIATERHLTQRVDRQLYGRSARQGDPGSAQAIIALDDELPRRFAPWLVKLAKGYVALRPGGVESKWVKWIFDRAERKAERMALAQRKGVLESDTWLKDTLGFAGEDL